MLHATTLCMLGLIVYSAYMEYQQVPVVTVVDSDNYPSQKLEFPGTSKTSVVNSVKFDFLGKIIQDFHLRIRAVTFG